MNTIKHKVLAYITQGDRLLVFSHPQSPEAGIQVPAGTVKDGEDLDAAVMREACEETGLAELRLVRLLGDEIRDLSSFGIPQIVHRHFYHLRCEGTPPETWRHYERDPSEGPYEPIPFDFFWVKLPDEVPPLAGKQDRFLPSLIETMR